MIYHKTLMNIRKRHGYTHEEFAKLMECPVEHIVALETGHVPVAYEFAVKLADKLNLHGAPIIESTRNALMDSLSNWKILIDYGLTDKAKQLKPELEKGAMSSYSPSTENLYYLFAADYYRLIGDEKAYDETMALLSQRVDTFAARPMYYYNCLVAAREHINRRYIEALKAYKAAAKLDKDNRLGDVRFYYGYGLCLSDMGHPVNAAERLVKAQHKAKWSKLYNGAPNRRFDVYIDCYLAYNLSKMYKSDEALEILDRRFEIEMKAERSKEKIGFVYHSYGSIYQIMRDYDKALENFDKAFQYLHTNGDAYKTNLYRKALVLIDSDKIEEGLRCIDKGLGFQLDDIRITMFEALRCSVTLTNPESLAYMQDVVMPKLLKYGQYEEIVKYFKLLREFHADRGEYNLALESADMALEIKEHLYDEISLGGLL